MMGVLITVLITGITQFVLDPKTFITSLDRSKLLHEVNRDSLYINLSDLDLVPS